MQTFTQARPVGFVRTAVIALIAGLSFSTYTSPAHADEDAPWGKIYVDTADKPIFDAPKGWTLESERQQNGKRYLSYRFAMDNVQGNRGLIEIALRKIAPASRFADMTPEMAAATEKARDEAMFSLFSDVEAMPGVDFLSGGTQAIYTATDAGKRYYNVQYIMVKGVPQEGNPFKPAVTIGVRCRNAVDVTFANQEATHDALETFCRDFVTGVQTK